MQPIEGKPGHDCPRCPRLVKFRNKWRAQEPAWFNAPVPSFGPREARLLIVGLAPGLQGANRTGRPFTGDYAGVLLYETLLHYDFARGQFQARADDGLELIDCRITNAVRCVPPENKPTPQEIATCRPFLTATIAEMPRLRAVIALARSEGLIGHYIHMGGKIGVQVEFGGVTPAVAGHPEFAPLTELTTVGVDEKPVGPLPR